MSIPLKLVVLYVVAAFFIFLSVCIYSLSYFFSCLSTTTHCALVLLVSFFHVSLMHVIIGCGRGRLFLSFVLALFCSSHSRSNLHTQAYAACHTFGAQPYARSLLSNSFQWLFDTIHSICCCLGLRECVDVGLPMCVRVYSNVSLFFFSLFRYKIVGALFFHLIHTKCDHMHINSDSIKSTDLCTFFDASFFSLSNSWLSFFYFAMNAFFFYLSPLCLRATSINISMCIVCVHFFSIQCTQPHAFAAGGHDFALNH